MDVSLPLFGRLMRSVSCVQPVWPTDGLGSAFLGQSMMLVFSVVFYCLCVADQALIKTAPRKK